MSALTNRYLPAVALVVALAFGGAITAIVAWLEYRAASARFDRMADIAASRVQERINQHLALLEATQSYLESLDGQVSRDGFASYVAKLDLAGAYRGIQGIGFARLMPRGAAAEAEREVRERYGVDVRVTPPPRAPLLAPIVLLEPQDARNRAALGYDMFSGPIRRAAMMEAVRRGTSQSSGPVLLVQEITDDKQAGFLVYLPVRTSAAHDMPAPYRGVAGFVYAPFRAGDLHAAALGNGHALPVSVRTVDVHATDIPLYDDGSASVVSGGRQVQRQLQVAGRQWRMIVREAAGFSSWTHHLPSLFMGAMSLLLALAVAGTLRSYQASIAAAEQATCLATRMAEDRTLMLREMQHRIKNHIARILAIARHTRRSSTDLAEFDRVFSARLQAMAAAQDLLSGAVGGEVDLRDLIQREIGQVMDEAHAASILDGTPLRLNGRQAQAVGLVIHELATNAMKYGNGTRMAEGLSIRWQIRPEDGIDWLTLIWSEPASDEPGPVPSRRGFGTELMESMIEGDLEGRLTRDFEPGGLRVTIAFPLHGGAGEA
ncbi:MAG TPA: CHASE domain-containing protein [Paracoccus sp. (in: a-proteobacteria)]|nr:CHASE domain-containing protein [Paracoccus sp. (in: a-proteobacteria)]